ncbi:hypothetical protein NX784_18195 [Massilia pinisoli]|uniref:Uncharacterized protein n=1 Tax=Massilia pinisoli TaxID=1772194 RepID=A0ABT1ZU99_9BURK|nr:hypothetical protein [Massilia pinisoli]MCS0583526.1 hypothetical protein [Massilia pinisoli]
MAALTVVATSELARFAGVASGVGFSIYAGFSFENTPMHHWSDGAFPRLHTVRIDGRVFFGGQLCSQDFRRGGVNFVWDGHSSV